MSLVSGILAGFASVASAINGLKYPTLSTKTGSYTLVLTDKDNVQIQMNLSSANNLTIPRNSSVAFPTGTQILIRQIGSGKTTIVAGTGVTLTSRGSIFGSAGQYAEIVITKIASDTWNAAGDLVA